MHQNIKSNINCNYHGARITDPRYSVMVVSCHNMKACNTVHWLPQRKAIETKQPMTVLKIKKPNKNSDNCLCQLMAEFYFAIINE